ncbi:MAG: DegT/DnrJ/EryC1/StrS family aminotransferase [Candidatus Omnitrophica bacterium]|nr:DegT/DnrJ/EryC1/StrS family aminotransferase [Candidatus Omnitrophota bacterium]
MKVPILNLKRQYEPIKAEIGAAIDKVVREQDFILGKEVSMLEEEIAKYCGTGFAVGLASGTDALILALKALGIKAGDEVITSPFTFFATAEAVSIVGAKPVFVDIEPKTYNIDPYLIEKSITKATKAIIPVHIYGQCADMDPVMNIAKKHALKVIEDTAQAIGAKYKGRSAGSMGDIGALSFFPSKNLGGFGDGGMIITNDRNLADSVKMLRVHGSSVRYEHSAIGMNSRLDNIQAAVLRIKLKYLDKWLELRRNKADYYTTNLKGLPLEMPEVPSHNVHTYHLFTLRARQDAEPIVRFLTDSGIESRAYYPIPLHLQKCYGYLGYKQGDFKEAEKASKQVFSIPLYPEMSDDEMKYVVSKLKEYFKA